MPALAGGLFPIIELLGRLGRDNAFYRSDHRSADRADNDSGKGRKGPDDSHQKSGRPPQRIFSVNVNEMLSLIHETLARAHQKAGSAVGPAHEAVADAFKPSDGIAGGLTRGRRRFGLGGSVAFRRFI